MPEITIAGPLRAVIDTNVFVSAFFREDTPPGRVLDDVQRGALLLLYDNRIIAEYREVLFRPKFPFERERLERFLQFVERRGRFVQDANFAQRLPDPDDQCFADVAFTGKADFLITGNEKDFPKSDLIRVVNPRQWVDEFRPMALIMDR